MEIDDRVRTYLDAAENANTKRSYASAIRHFQNEGRGCLPATEVEITRYLSTFAGSLANSTLTHRLAAISKWHEDHGFSDPTKGSLVRQTLKGIRSLHPQQRRVARPLSLDDLIRVDEWLQVQIKLARIDNSGEAELRLTRDRALVLVGFWCGFRSSDLANLRVELIHVVPGERIDYLLSRSKGDRQATGTELSCPALSKLCPVAAYEAWRVAADLTHGPVFRKLDKRGTMGTNRLTGAGIAYIFSELLKNAGVQDWKEYSTHSLRRGFATGATANGMGLVELMKHVGWKDANSATGYIDKNLDAVKRQIEGWLIAKP